MSTDKQDDPDLFAAPTDWAVHFDLSIQSESTRAKVVLSACYLDVLLSQLLEILLKPAESEDDPLLTGPNAPLSSMSGRIELA